MYQAEALFSKW